MNLFVSYLTRTRSMCNYLLNYRTTLWCMRGHRSQMTFNSQLSGLESLGLQQGGCDTSARSESWICFPTSLTSNECTQMVLLLFSLSKNRNCSVFFFSDSMLSSCRSLESGKVTNLHTDCCLSGNPKTWINFGHLCSYDGLDSSIFMGYEFARPLRYIPSHLFLCTEGDHLSMYLNLNFILDKNLLFGPSVLIIKFYDYTIFLISMY